MSRQTLETFSLGFGQRLVLQQLLGQQQGNQMTATVIQKFVEDLAVTEDEQPLFDAFGGSMPMLAHPRDFTFSPWRLSKIREMLRNLDAAGQVTLSNLTLFKVFMPAVTETADASLAAEYAAMTAEAEAEAEACDTAAILSEAQSVLEQMQPAAPLRMVPQAAEEQGSAESYASPGA